MEVEVEVEVVHLEINEDGTMSVIIDPEVATVTTTMETVDEITMTTIVAAEEEIMVMNTTVVMAMATELATEIITAAVVAAGIRAMDTAVIEDTTAVEDETMTTNMVVATDHQQGVIDVSAMQRTDTKTFH